MDSSSLRLPISRSFSLPVPLPPEMHTHRSLARSISISILFVWAIIFTFGVRYLYRENSRPNTIIDVLLQQGEHDWGIFHTEGDSCLGYFTSVLANSEEPRFSLSGSVLLPTSEGALPLRFHSDLSFGKFYELDNIDADANIGELTWTVRSDNDHPENLLVTTTQQGEQRESVQTIPHPLFLDGRGNNTFRLVFAKEHPLERVLEYDEPAKSFHHGRLFMRQISTEDLTRCQTSIDTRANHQTLPKSFVDEVSNGSSPAGGL